MTLPHPWSDISPRSMRIIADCGPERAVDALRASLIARGMDLTVNHPNFETAGASTIEGISHWVRGGSKLLPLSADVLATLNRLGPEPRWHALDPSGPCFMFSFRGDDPLPSLPSDPLDRDAFDAALKFARGRGYNPLNARVFVRPTPDGADARLWLQSCGAGWHNALRFGVEWTPSAWGLYAPGSDFIRGLERAEGSPAAYAMLYMGRLLRFALQALAAIHAGGAEIHHRAARAEQKREARKSRSSGSSVSPMVYRLDPSGLRAWTKIVLADQPPRLPATAPSDASSRTPARMHVCTKHTRTYWVARPAEGEAVLGVREGRPRKDGTRITLYRVEREIERHVRGNEVRPRPVVLYRGSEESRTPLG